MFRPVETGEPSEVNAAPSVKTSKCAIVTGIIIPIILGAGAALAAYYLFQQPILWTAVIGGSTAVGTGVIAFLLVYFFGRKPIENAPKKGPVVPANTEIKNAPKKEPHVRAITQLQSYPGPLSNEQKREISLQSLGENQLQIAFNDETLQRFNITIRNQDLFESGAKVIVNAANSHLGGGSGIDGEIHERGGAVYAEAHAALSLEHRHNYPSGYATVLPPGELADMDWVIVVAGPMWLARDTAQQNNKEKAQQLYSCYYNSLLLAHQNHCTSIAIPSISQGIFRFPAEIATPIVLRALYDFAHTHPDTPLKTISIHFIARTNRPFNDYQNALQLN